jgi:hypothetical protein
MWVVQPTAIEWLAKQKTYFAGRVTFNLLPGAPRPTLQGMFDNITAELATATDKLAHLRRFL